MPSDTLSGVLSALRDNCLEFGAQSDACKLIETRITELLTHNSELLKRARDAEQRLEKSHAVEQQAIGIMLRMAQLIIDRDQAGET